jgi:2-succinyl-6-hydroxy-2,4-cyclohexadiene-1-carboxylate synthase
MIAAMPAIVVLLHGFAGTGHAWDAVSERLDGERYRALAPDIRGHGAAGHERPIGFAECVADVLAAAPERFDLCGYSMGGRLALQVALTAPERVGRLVMVSTTAGIEEEGERARRRAEDVALADEIERSTIEQFAERWLAQPLFASDDAETQARARADILRNDPRSLAAAVRGIGTGAMAPLWDRLGELVGIETVLVTGERDAKFRQLGERMASLIPNARHVEIAGAGHALPRERPAELAALLLAGERRGPSRRPGTAADPAARAHRPG